MLKDSDVQVHTCPRMLIESRERLSWRHFVWVCDDVTMYEYYARTPSQGLS